MCAYYIHHGLPWFPDSLTREEGSVNQNIKHPCQMVLHVTPYMAKTPFLPVL
jgi:hypothetical protein